VSIDESAKASTFRADDGVLGSWPVSSRRLPAGRLTALHLPDGVALTLSINSRMVAYS
jgi:hypothetical protein